MAAYGFIVILILMFGVFYLMVIRPQRKRQSEHQQLVQGLQRGDKVITIGGIYGEIDAIAENDVILKMEDGSRVKFLKTSVMGKQQADEPRF
ncbi:MAG: preprotein translocase subunit YajC [Dehalococcoidia bacterium]